MLKKGFFYSISFICIVFSCHTLNLASHVLEQETTIGNYFRKAYEDHKPSGLEVVDCIYLLNLEKRPEKLANTLEQLAPYDINANRFEAIDGWDNEDVIERFWLEQKELLPEGANMNNFPPVIPTKVACILSHLSIIQDAYDRGYQCIWILQDDIEVLDNPHKIDQRLKELSVIDPNWGLLFTDLDMVSPEYKTTPLRALSIERAYRSNQDIMPLFWYLKRKNIDDNFQEIRMRYGFHSVLISRKGMERILDYFKHVVIQCAFDIDIHFITDLPKYGLRNSIISNAKWKMSDIGRRTPRLCEFPPPYCNLKKVLNFVDHGFYANTESMEALLKATQPKIVVELGSWLGKSTRHMAKILGEGGKVYAVDHWKGNIEHRNPSRVDVFPLLPNLYEQFLSNVMHENLTHKIIPWKMTTLEAAEKAEKEKLSIDLVYVDAAHDEESVYQDLCAWYPFVKNKGILCGDDWSWGEELPVRRAVKRFAEENNLRIIVPSWNFWIVIEKWRKEVL